MRDPWYETTRRLRDHRFSGVAGYLAAIPAEVVTTAGLYFCLFPATRRPRSQRRVIIAPRSIPTDSVSAETLEASMDMAKASTQATRKHAQICHSQEGQDDDATTNLGHGRLIYHAVIPPSTARSEPVIHELSSQARKSAADAIS